MKSLRHAAVGLAALVGISAALPAAARLPGRPAVLVQDFRNRSYDIRHDWVGTGLAYLVRKNLGSLSGLEMLEDRKAKPGETEPVADYVVEGEIRLDESGDATEPKFVVFVTLDRAGESTGRRQFLTEGRASQLLEMGGYLTERIARHVGLEVDEAMKGRFGRGMTANLSAYQLFAEAIVERRIHAKTEAYERAVMLDPRFAEACFHLGRVHTVLRDHVRAAQALRQAIELVPDFAEAHNDLAYVLAQQGQIVEAEAEYRTAILSDPQAARYRLNLGDLLRLQGKLEAARAQYDAALRLRPDDAEAQAAMALLSAGPGPGGAVRGGAAAAVAQSDRSTAPAGAPGPLATPPVATPPVATPPVATPPVATPPVATPPVATPPVATPPVATPPVATPPPAPLPRPVQPTAKPSLVVPPAPVGNPAPAIAGAAPALDEDVRELELARKAAAGSRGDRTAAQALVEEARHALAAGARADFYSALARLYEAEKLQHATADALRRAVAADPARGDLRRKLADVYERIGRKRDAERERSLAGTGGS